MTDNSPTFKRLMAVLFLVIAVAFVATTIAADSPSARSAMPSGGCQPPSA